MKMRGEKTSVHFLLAFMYIFVVFYLLNSLSIVTYLKFHNFPFSHYRQGKLLNTGSCNCGKYLVIAIKIYVFSI